jgi:sugar lactone lactonase YvrE
MRSPISLLSQYTQRLAGRKPSRTDRPEPIGKHTRRSSLCLELLEDRALLSGFNFADFSSASGLNLVGAAAITPGNVLRLTPSLGGQNGAAWYTAAKQFAGLAFQSTFQFQLTKNAAPHDGSDGLVFILQNTAPSYLAGGGGTLGYDGLRNSLAVEFDTYQNSEVSDPSHSHISVHTNGTGANGWSESLSLGSYSTNPIIDDGVVHTARITYTPGTLAVYLDNLTTPKLTVAVDLAEKLNLDAGRAWVGFTAATGGGAGENHDILNWSYTVIPDVTTTVWASDTSVTEGNAGTANLVFTVNRSGDTSGMTTVNWATEDRTAIAGIDYTVATGSVMFAPGVTQQTVTISINGETAIEPHETLALRLSGASGGSLADGVGIGTILTDDVTVSVSDTSAVEGGSTLKVLDRFVSEGSGDLARPRGLIFGPDANLDGAQDLYVASADTDAILRYDGVTGAFIDAFVTSGSGGLDSPVDLAFGPDGNLYVTSPGTNQVLRYDGSSGSFLGIVASGLASPQGLTFGADGSLYIANQDTDEVLRYHNSSLSVFVSAGSGGLDRPRQAVFGLDGNLYVASAETNQVLRYDGLTGAFIDTFATTSLGGTGPSWLEFGTDGYLYVTARTTSVGSETSIVRFDATTGGFVDRFDLGRDGWSFILGPDNVVYNSSNGEGNFIERLGPSSLAAFTVSLSSASAAPVTVSYTTANVTATAGSDYVGTSGTLTFAPGQTTRTVLVQTLPDTLAEGSETFVLNLTSATGATIADAQGVATIFDQTKFYVVNDGPSDRTYEYGTSGSAIENYALTSGNTAPRGAASTAAGTTVWVVDANKRVYVYNPSGGLLGSWTAGSLHTQAQVEGITTDGTDVWIVDAKQDKVLKYTGAASRTTASQNAASSFNLNSGNSNPKGLVTDGIHFWVVNDASTDKVFKYTLAGALVGSWAIGAANASPTGITLDPANVGHLWIVDNGTDRVYQYDNAAGRTSGSQSPSTSFALAAGNTNPQDIADPPALDSTRMPLSTDFAGSAAGKGTPLAHTSASASADALLVTALKRRKQEHSALTDAVFADGVGLLLG